MSTKKVYEFIFGPVPSRRLGVSLGIDLVPHKTCSLNCIYCECGRTTCLTINRREYVPTNKVIAELRDYLSSSPDLDYITFSGSGEPTLHSGIGTLVSFLKREFPNYKLALLTNGTLFADKSLRKEVSDADLIIPSLDGASDVAFHKINRPHPNVTMSSTISGLIELRKEYKGEIWLEVFIVPGINDSEADLMLFKETLLKLRPDRLQLNTLDRPGTEDWVMPASKARMDEIASFLGGEVIAHFSPRTQVPSFSRDVEQSIMSTLSRRPCTIQDLSKSMGLHQNEVSKYLQTLLSHGKIDTEKKERGNFFYKSR
jgi:wyosine [tRNA(Phe)-imidazoG37] synthetase (radical SAM superfamily)